MDISTNRISLTFDDAERMEKKNVSVQDAKDGGISQIQVGATMDCSVQEAGKHHIVYTEAEAKQLQKQNMVPLDDAQMSPADFISRCMTGKDAKAVSEDGTPLEEYTSSQLERAVTRIKKERHEKQEAVEREVSKQREKDEAVSKNAAQLAVDGNVPDAVIDRLLDSDLPVTEENVAKLSHAVDMASEIRSFSDAAMKFFIDNENTILTPESVNAGVHGAVEGEENPSSEENDFSLVENQVRSRLEESGMEADDENMAAAKWLYEEDLPVTAENVALSSQVKELKETKDSVLAARIADQMAEGVQPEKANLVKLSVAEAVRFKRRLAETQLTMTADAIRTMSEKGISIDVTKLEDVVEKLRAAEKEAYQSELFNADLPVTEENINTLKETSQAVKQVLSAPVEFMGYAFTQGVEDTLSSLSSKAEAFTASFDMVENRYESVGTEVRRDLGDSLTKAFSNIDTLLEEAGFETTARNERAVRALAYNQMPLTEENLVSVKEYDERVTTLMKSMKPEVVCELIRKGENPLEKTLDELQNDVNEILAQNDIEDISFRKYLWKMDHTDGLTEDERETMIGVYRLLHQIEKSDGAAAAQVLNEGKELSLSSLLSAVRTRKKAGMDVSVDDSFGMEKEVIASKNSISEQIYAAYGQNIAADLTEKLSPQVLKEAMGGNEEISAEALLERCEEAAIAEENTFYENEVRSVREAAAKSESEVINFLEALDLPATLSNLSLVQEFRQMGAGKWRDLWKEEDTDAVLDAMEEPDSLDDVFTEIEENMQKELVERRESDDITYDEITWQNQMSRLFTFHGAMRRCQVYEVPILTEFGITTCNITIRDGVEKEKGSIEIAMNSKEFGRLQASFKVKEKKVNGFVTVEDETSVSSCQERMDAFEKELEEIGFTMDGNTLITGQRTSLSVGNKKEGAKNQDLYRIARLFVVTMNRKDDDNEN